MTRKEFAIQRKSKLVAISKVAKMAVATGEFESVNEFIVDSYKDEENTDFNTYKGWLEEGQQVKKGEHSEFPIWGRKRKATKKATENNKEDEEFKFFPVANLFSNRQVEPKETEDE